MSEEEAIYKHEKHAGNHADVFKHVVFCAVIREMQKQCPEGIIVADAHSGFGVYDLSAQAEPAEYQQGIGKVLQRYSNTAKVNEIPLVIRDYVKTVLETVGAEGVDDFDLYPGSPLLAQSLLRPEVDLHRLTDLHMEEVEGLNNPSDFRALDCYDPATLDFLMPTDCGDKQNVILLDGSYKNHAEFGQIKDLLERILDRNPKATVLVWIPFIHGHRFRWSFATGLRELAKEKAKVGRYYANIVIAKTGLQGSAMLVCNPPALFDDLVDPNALHWLAHVMNQGKDEYTVEQIMKKKKKKAEATA